MMRFVASILVLPILIVLFQSCSQIFDPDVSSTESNLIIEGLFTNIKGESYVKISKSTPFDSCDYNSILPEDFVQIVDNNGEDFIFTYQNNNTYVNIDAFGEIGKTYFLRVITSNGEIYGSAPETMIAPFTQDSIYARAQTQVLYETNPYGKLIEHTIYGLSTFVNLKGGSDLFPRCRYSTIVTLLYTYQPEGSFASIVYGWKSLDITGHNFNITKITNGAKTGEIKNHNIGFWGSSINFFELHGNKMIKGYFIHTTKFNLNQHAFDYYTNITFQLSGSQRLFDPAPSQLKGNIECISHPNTKVFGIFDVSSEERRFYYLNKENSLRVTLIPDLNGLTPEGESVDGIPTFWPKYQ